MFSKWMQITDQSLDWLERVIITLGLAGATLLMFANVVARYVFETGLTWALEAVQYTIAWVVLIGAAHLVKAGGHLGIDILVEKFPPLWQRRLVLAALFSCLLFVGVVFYYSIIYTMEIRMFGDLSEDLRMPQWIPYLSIPIGLGLMFIHFVRIGFDIWHGHAIRIHKREGEDELEEMV
ncbi:TRAP transporter small permease [Magnetococcus sp. PR-3]|uniref:TRAP transporter small permease n=1 Tax=Magnetococcus sp. PR-3 TaxID=3120355 RepID=UPI002FCDF36A